jgi:predicted nuclease of predicted toxin-antitoxin system
LTGFLIDECVVGFVIPELRSLGADVMAVSEVSRGIDDIQVLEMSVAHGRVLVSADYGFGELVFRLGMDAVGIVLIAPDVVEKDPRAASKMIAERIVETSASLAGRLTVMEKERTRQRPLPNREN